MHDPLIHGKNSLTNIVGVEVEEDKAIIFTETDGVINTQLHKNKFWVLCPTTKSNSVPLKGNLHYKFGIQFDSKDEWFKQLSKFRKDRLDFFTIYDNKESLLTKDGLTYYKGMKHNEPSILSFDIEANGLYHTPDSKVLLISNTFRKNGIVTRKLFSYTDYSSDQEFIDNWCNWVREMNPSIICGHNIYSYDLPYLLHFAELNGTTLRLGRNNSPIKINSKASKFRVDGSRDQEYYKVRVYGRELIDTMFLAIKYDTATKKYDSYGLKNIIKQEGLEKQDRVHYDSSKIRFNYKDKNEWKKIKEYCEHDADDSLTLFDLMAPSIFYLTQSVPKTFQQMVESATGSQINSMMIRSYLQEGHSIPKASQTKQFEGAISFGNPGIYRNVYKVDVTSLYPSIILQCDVYDPEKDPRGNFLKIIQTFTNERIKNKKLAKTSKYHDDLQSAQKIVINSGYGFLGAEGLNFNSPEAAKFITKTGRDVLQIAIDWAKTKNMKIVNADTDSISFCKLDETEFTEGECLELLTQLNSQYPEKIRFEDDGLYKTVCVLKAKNYVLYDGNKIKIKGSALKATQKALALKEFIQEVIQYIIKTSHVSDDNIISIYNKYVKEIDKIHDIKRWAARKTISEKTLNSERTNELRIREAIEGTEVVEGDRVWTYYTSTNNLKLADQFDGDYNKDRLLQNLYDTAWTFETILNCDSLFKNYKLKKNKTILQELLND